MWMEFGLMYFAVLTSTPNKHVQNVFLTLSPWRAVMEVFAQVILPLRPPHPSRRRHSPYQNLCAALEFILVLVRNSMFFLPGHHLSCPGIQLSLVLVPGRHVAGAYETLPISELLICWHRREICGHDLGRDEGVRRAEMTDRISRNILSVCVCEP